MFTHVPRGVSGVLEWTSSKSPYLDSLFELQQVFFFSTGYRIALKLGQKNHLRMPLTPNQPCVHTEPRVLPFSHLFLLCFPVKLPEPGLPGGTWGRIWSGESCSCCCCCCCCRLCGGSWGQHNLNFIGLRVTLQKDEQICSGNASQTDAFSFSFYIFQISTALVYKL